MRRGEIADVENVDAALLRERDWDGELAFDDLTLKAPVTGTTISLLDFFAGRLEETGFLERFLLARELQTQRYCIHAETGKFAKIGTLVAGGSSGSFISTTSGSGSDSISSDADGVGRLLWPLDFSPLHQSPAASEVVPREELSPGRPRGVSIAIPLSRICGRSSDPNEKKTSASKKASEV
jgi:hypothetical protein